MSRSGIVNVRMVITEEKILSNIDRNALAEIDDNITMTMIEEKKEYGRDLETKKKDK